MYCPAIGPVKLAEWRLHYVELLKLVSPLVAGTGQLTVNLRADCQSELTGAGYPHICKLTHYPDQGSVNVINDAPAATATYCLPSSE